MYDFTYFLFLYGRKHVWASLIVDFNVTQNDLLCKITRNTDTKLIIVF